MAVAAATMVGLSPGTASAQAKPIAEQIAEAVFALPEAERDGAMVWGWQGEAEMMEVIRKGTNDFVCLADKPGDQGFSISCYEKRLEPFMARGRELRAEGKGTGEVRRIRRSETVLRVIYLPNATPESTGKPASAPRGEPFLMEAGTYRAHLMIPSGRIPFTP
jgi:hypothetical protein